ncbi:MAG: hypothetical protein IIW98_07450, partial [Bacteroidaceae bacterium]|nr:hypothetical protein [Bacteroidaceae bacterium]
DEITVRNNRLALGIRPEFGEVDTCAGEFEAKTPYIANFIHASGLKDISAPLTYTQSSPNTAIALFVA